MAPRFGVNYAFGGGKTVVKAFWGRFYNELTTVLGNNSNPGGENYRIYKFNDLNGNRLYDGQAELGTLVSARGGISTVIDEDFNSPYADEISSALEHQFWGESSVRVAYVRKMVAQRDRADQRRASRPVHRAAHGVGADPGLRRPGHRHADVRRLRHPRLAARRRRRTSTATGPTPATTTTPSRSGFNKRWPGGFFLQSSFDYQWRDELRGGTATQGDSRINITTSPLNTDPLGVGFFQNVRPDVPNRQQTTNWQARIAGRYVFKYDIGLGVNYRVQSGYGYTRVASVSLPNAGTAQFFFDDLDNQYLGHGADPRPAPRQDGRARRPLPRRGDARRLQHAQQQRRVELQHHQRHAVQPHHRHAGSAGRCSWGSGSSSSRSGPARTRISG